MLALVVASLLWGTTGTAASFLPDDVNPLAIGASTMGIGGVLLFLTAPRVSFRALALPEARRWLLIGAIGVFVYPLAFYVSMDLAGVAIGNVVSLGTGPVFAAILEWGIERTRLSRLWAACTAIAVIGVALLAVGGHGGGSAASAGAGSVVLGVLSGVLAGAAYALYTYASSRAIRAGAPSRAAMGAMFGVGAIGLMPVLITLGAPLTQSLGSLGVAAYLALGPMFVAYVLFGIGMRTLRSTTATTITLLEPLVATLLAVVVVGERLDPVAWLGLGLILVGVTVLATARRPTSEDASA